MSAELKNTMSFSDEQSMLLDTAVEFCKEASPIAEVRDLVLTDSGFRTNVWQQIVDLGWTGVAVPEEFGGSNLGLAAVVPLAESMGRRLLGAPFVATQLATQTLVAGGNPDQQANWLPKIVAGSPATIAFVEEDGDWNLQAITATLADGVLMGTKSLVLDAQVAQLIAVSVLVDGQVAVALVPGAAIPPNQIVRDVVLDETRRSYTVVLDGVAVAPDQLITGASAIAALNATEQAAWLLHAADACGGTNATIDLVVEYLNTRTQFGRKIGSYQSLKHPTVDMLMGLERARSHVYHAASLLTAGEEAEVALRMAKSASDDAYNFAADRAIQFHGGFGFTYECDAQLYLRRALWLQYQFGDSPHHRAALQPLLLGERQA